MTVQLSHIFVHVRSLPRSRESWADRLGLDVLVDEPGYRRLGGGSGFHLDLELSISSPVAEA